MAERDLEGRPVMITAGPTREAIDPVRYISNHSSGKMGFAIAEAAAARGAEVYLIAGPVELETPEGVTRIDVISARDMLAAAEELFPQASIGIFAAAVCDMRPKVAHDAKLKKGRDDEALASIELVPNPDILARCCELQNPSQVSVGFAAETDNLIENANRKLETKKADMIVANCVADGAVFGADTNKAYLVTRNRITELPEMSKRELSDAILDAALELL